jgi:hypothetical protein
MILNRRIINTPLEPVVITHECTHLATQFSTEILNCKSNQAAVFSEKIIWIATARLSVSEEQLGALESGAITKNILSHINGIPAQIIDLRVASTLSQRRRMNGWMNSPVIETAMYALSKWLISESEQL